MLVLVLNKLSEALYKIVDDAIELEPELKDHREELYKTALCFYNERGTMPQISVKPIESPKNQEEDNDYGGGIKMNELTCQCNCVHCMIDKCELCENYCGVG